MNHRAVVLFKLAIGVALAMPIAANGATEPRPPAHFQGGRKAPNGSENGATETAPLASIAKAVDAARVAPRADGWAAATQIYAYQAGALYQLRTAVGQISDITLQEGERLSEEGAVAAGDTARWVIGQASSGSGAQTRVSILVKPTQSRLRTNLVISTNRRTYHVELLSGATAYMPGISWTYPADALFSAQITARAARRQQERTEIESAIDPTSLNFAYLVKGDKVSWRPIHVFDDGHKTFVAMPPGIERSELPPLFLIDEGGKASLVNYRVVLPYLIIDRLFDQAELRLGSKKQKRVRLERLGAKARP